MKRTREEEERPIPGPALSQGKDKGETRDGQYVRGARPEWNRSHCEFAGMFRLQHFRVLFFGSKRRSVEKSFFKNFPTARGYNKKRLIITERSKVFMQEGRL